MASLDDDLETLARDYLKAVQRRVIKELGVQLGAAGSNGRAHSLGDRLPGLTVAGPIEKLRTVRHAFEVAYIRRVLEHYPDLRHAARLLGISFSALKAKLAPRYVPKPANGSAARRSSIDFPLPEVTAGGPVPGLRKVRREFEVAYIHQVMKRYPDRREAARVLGISHSAVKDKLSRTYVPAR